MSPKNSKRTVQHPIIHSFRFLEHEMKFWPLSWSPGWTCPWRRSGTVRRTWCTPGSSRWSSPAPGTAPQHSTHRREICDNGCRGGRVCVCVKVNTSTKPLMVSQHKPASPGSTNTACCVLHCTGDKKSWMLFMPERLYRRPSGRWRDDRTRHQRSRPGSSGSL